MPIVSSVVTQDSKNRTGVFRYVGFTLTDHLGVVHRYGNMHLDIGADINVFMASLVVKADRFLKGRDLRDAVYKEPWNYGLKENTEAELLDYARAEYRQNDNVELVPVSDRLNEWMNNGRFTQGQVRSAFNMNQPDFVQFRQRMNDVSNGASNVRNAKGE